MIPTSDYNESILYGAKNSREMLKIFDNIHYDMSNLFYVASTYEQAIKSNMDALILQNYFLQMKVNDLEKSISDLRNDIDSNTAGGFKTTTLKFDSNYILTTNNLQAVQMDVNHGFSTLPYKQISKTNASYNGKTYIYPSLKVDVNIIKDGLATPVNDSLTNLNKIFDGSNSSYWLYYVDYDIDSDIEEVMFQVSVDLPVNVSNNPFINALTINTMPEYSMDIVKLVYLDPTHRNIYEFDHFPVDGIKNSSRHIFTLPNTETYSIIAVFRQPYYFIQNNKKRFYFGIQDIGVYFYDYLSEYAYALSKLSTTKNLKIINTPTVNTAPGTPTNIKNLVSHELFLPDENGYVNISPGQSIVEFGQEIQGLYNQAYILTKIERNVQTVPIIRDITIQYATLF